MTCSSRSIVGMSICIAAIGIVSSAQASATTNACTIKMYSEIAKEQRKYRSHLYGEATASGANVGKVLFDERGKPWIKVQYEEEAQYEEEEEEEEETWMSVSGDSEDSKSNSEAATLFGLSEQAAGSAPNGTVRSDEEGKLWVKVGGQWLSPEKKRTDEEMEDGRELWPRDGLFATKRMLTSELIPYLTQSMRAFQCNTYAICERMERSVSAGERGSLTVHVPGCKEKNLSVLQECNFAKEGAEDLSAAGTAFRTCRTIVEAMVQQESDLLRLATEYDAAYRSILQIAGNFDLSLRTFKWPLINTIRQAAGIIGQLGRVPCLLSVCDRSPIDENLPPQ